MVYYVSKRIHCCYIFQLIHSYTDTGATPPTMLVAVIICTRGIVCHTFALVPWRCCPWLSNARSPSNDNSEEIWIMQRQISFPPCNILHYVAVKSSGNVFQLSSKDCCW